MPSKLKIDNGTVKGEIHSGGSDPFTDVEIPDKYFLDGTEVTEAAFKEVFPDHEGAPGGHSSSGWPLKSEAAACHPTQVAEMNERNLRHGVATTYLPDGTAVIPNRGDRKKLLRLEGYHDRDGGYGD